MTEILSAGLLLEPYQIIIRPLLTEKSVHQAQRAEGLKEVAERRNRGAEEREYTNAYAFEVHPDASKDDIRMAVEKLFDVKVLRVNTQNRKGKPRRYKNKAFKTASWKKAIVFLAAGQRIEFFEGASI